MEAEEKVSILECETKALTNFLVGGDTKDPGAPIKASCTTNNHIETKAPESQNFSGSSDEGTNGITTSTSMSPRLPTFYSNLTPPKDEALYPSNSQSYYQGYGHMPYSAHSSQHTPPTAQTPSPIDITYNNHNQISFNPQPHMPFHPPPPLYPVYHGYSYGSVQPTFSPVARSTSSQRSPSQSDNDPSVHVGSEAEAQPTFQAPIETRPSSILSHDSTYSEPKSVISPIETSFHEVALSHSINGGFVKLDSLILCHGNLSEYDQDADAARPLFAADLRSADLFPCRGPQYEDWRHAVLAKLDQAGKPDSLSPAPHHLVQHLARQFNTRENADYCLRISHESHRFEILEFFIHSLLTDQSPLLRNLRKSTTILENGLASLQIQTRDRFITPQAIETTLLYCYGKPINDFNGFPEAIATSKSSVELSILWMKNALAVAAAGHMFHLGAVISRGLQVASTILNWGNIERALSFTLDGGLEPVLEFDRILTNTTASSSPFGDAVAAVATPSPGTSENFEARPSIECEESSDCPSRSYSPSANDFLRHCLDFVVSEFPLSWELDTTAKPLAEIDRLPANEASRSPLTKSRLSLIQFGDHPSEKERQCDADIALSSLLLSVSFPLLVYILNRFDETLRTRIMNPIINERERRRHKALKLDSVSCDQRQLSGEDWAQLGWEEFVDSENPGLSLQRKWVGFSESPGA